MTAKAISTRVQQMLNEYVAQDDNKNNKMYVVEGEEDTEFEGMMFAFCTTMEKAEKALKLCLFPDELKITEVIIDTVIIDNKIIEV